MKTTPFDRVFHSLEDFVDTISDTLSCPVTLEDANHQLLAYSSHDDETDAARISTIIGRRVPEKVINRFWQEGVIPALHQSDQPLDIPSITELGLRNRVAISIRKNQEILGYIWVIEVKKKLTAADKQLMKIAADKAKNLLMQLTLKKKHREQTNEQLLWQLITEKQSHHTIATLFKEAGIPQIRALTIMAISFPKLDDSLYRNVKYIAKTTKDVQLVINTTDRNQIIFLLSPLLEHAPEQALREFSRTMQEQMKERFAVKDMTIGCGYLYNDYSKLIQSYQEAQKVVSAKKWHESELTFNYFLHELGIYRYLDIIQQHTEPVTIENPLLKNLLIYDTKNSTSLFETLDVFLSKDGNVNETSKALHIHVNTLAYRMKRIQEITDIQLKDPLHRLALLFEIKLSTLAKKGLQDE